MPDLPGCVAVGETPEEAGQLIREAIQFHIEGLREEGLPVPDYYLGQKVSQAGSHGRLHDRPHAGPEPVVPRRETVPDPGEQTSSSHAARMNPVNYTPSREHPTRS